MVQLPGSTRPRLCSPPSMGAPPSQGGRAPKGGRRRPPAPRGLAPPRSLSTGDSGGVPPGATAAGGWLFFPSLLFGATNATLFLACTYDEQETCLCAGIRVSFLFI